MYGVENFKEKEEGSKALSHLYVQEVSNLFQAVGYTTFVRCQCQELKVNVCNALPPTVILGVDPRVACSPVVPEKRGAPQRVLGHTRTPCVEKGAWSDFLPAAASRYDQP